MLSVPYSQGFTAYVDGKETKLQKANTMFMALELEPGEHEIRLTYCTPYLKPGIVLSVTGLILYVLLVLYRKKKSCCSQTVIYSNRKYLRQCNGLFCKFVYN